MTHTRGSRLVSSIALASLVVLLIGATTVAAQEPEPEVEVTTGATIPEEIQQTLRRMIFPVDGEHRFVNDWYYPRDGAQRRHWGIDIPAVRMTPLVAVTDGTVTRIRHSNDGAEGNMVIITDSDGWRYLYIHLNNDTPGTADNANLPEYAFAPGLVEGMTVRAGQLIGFVGDSGHTTGPHLHFGMTDPSGQYINPYWSLLDADSAGQTPFDFLCRGSDNPKWGLTDLVLADPALAGADGVVIPTTTGAPSSDAGTSADDIVDPNTTTTTVDPAGGQVDGATDPNDPANVQTAALRPVIPGTSGLFVGAPTTTTTTLPPAGPVTAGDSSTANIQVVLGGALDIASLGDAGFRGSLGDIELDGIVDIERTTDGEGFYLLDRWGDVQELGTARYFGSIDDSEATGEAVAIASTTDGEGYWIVEANGAIHPFGDAENFGDLGEGWLTAPLVDFSPSSDGEGLILVAEDGTVFAMGHARYSGSLLDLQGIGLVTPVAVQTTVTGGGYWILGDNGQVLTFGDAAFSGSDRGGAACRWDNAVGAVSFSDGTGSWIVADDLQAWAFGSARETGPLRASDPIGVTPPPDTPVVLPRDESDDAPPEDIDDGSGGRGDGSTTGNTDEVDESGDGTDSGDDVSADESGDGSGGSSDGTDANDESSSGDGTDSGDDVSADESGDGSGGSSDGVDANDESSSGDGTDSGDDVSADESGDGSGGSSDGVDANDESSSGDGTDSGDDVSADESGDGSGGSSDGVDANDTPQAPDQGSDPGDDVSAGDPGAGGEPDPGNLDPNDVVGAPGQPDGGDPADDVSANEPGSGPSGASTPGGSQPGSTNGGEQLDPNDTVDPSVIPPSAPSDPIDDVTNSGGAAAGSGPATGGTGAASELDPDDTVAP